MINKSVLLTGANGFLGSCLAEKLSKKYTSVTLTSYHSGRNPKIQPVDLLDFAKIRNLVFNAKPDIVIHAGSFVDLSRDYEIGQQCIDSNVKGTLNLLEALRSHPPQKIIYTSTEEIYGNGPIPYVETQNPDPPSLYSISKLAAEHMCRLYAKELGIKLVILRIATFYGPGQPERRFIPQMILKALKNEPVLINSGVKKRDYIYIDDVVNGILLACETELATDIEVMNLGGGQSYSLIYLAKMIISKAKSSSVIKKNAFPDRAGEADKWILDIAKAKKMLMWQPKVSLEEGITKEIEYFKAYGSKGKKTSA